MSAFLEVEDLNVRFTTEDGVVRAVDGVTFDVDKGRTLAIVGESGSGKSVTSAAIMGLHNPRRTHVSGSIRLDGEEIVTASPERLRELRGKRMAMIFQDPLSSLHPFFTIGSQLVEAVQVHRDINKSDAKKRAVELLKKVGIPNAERRAGEFPHQLSGGMRQRVMIAMALINDPDLLIADEPTTALDVTVQAQIIELLKSLQSEFGTAIILITHDLGVVAETADDVAVMYGARVVERGTVRDIFYRPQMPYTWGLLSSLPRLDEAGGGRLSPIPGQPPSLINLPQGCVFRPRCQYHQFVTDGRCDTVRPVLDEVAEGHSARCHLSAPDKQRLAAERLASVAPNTQKEGA
ncbi:ABC transporter ATP-binding protein [Angustibacter luteus]|uniref:ABC transporter ATP-binding protein n=1 Tax=Angustibacter luteus TaxID=658456 RepID=A0ABW1JJA9_9ACTN